MSTHHFILRMMERLCYLSLNNNTVTVIQHEYKDETSATAEKHVEHTVVC